MKRGTITIFFFIIIQSAFGQIGYEEGYFIDNEDNKTECHIYNKDWRNNPSIIKFRIEEDGTVATTDLLSVQELGKSVVFKISTVGNELA